MILIMRNIIFIMLALLLPIEAMSVKREHRSVWMSAWISDWPTSAITSANAHSHQKFCLNNLDSLQRNNFTTVYFHVRAMCDAAYDSKYEPWAKCISGARGATPAFDPLRFLLDNAHERGLEVYAWFNPYRYSSNGYYGDAGGDKNYENSHPDWLINDEGYITLNPALPEVKQRVVDVIADLLSKYDVDGVVFDDYFYSSGLPMSEDKDLYDKYVADGGTLSQGDWRRENVNDMVRMVNNFIKENYPWVRFGIGPAGVAASNKAVADKYGVEPCPGNDWQYNSIYSDPLAWYADGSIDFMSPQIYHEIGSSAADYGKIAPWWYDVAKKFNRHAYISQSMAEENSYLPYSEFVDEIELVRTSSEYHAPGTVYFSWRWVKNNRQRVEEGKNTIPVMPYLRWNIFNHPSLTPAVDWISVDCPGIASNINRNGRTITWDGPDNVRFVIYSVPKDIALEGFHKEEEYIRGISYSKSYAIPEYDDDYPEFGIKDEDLDNYNYAVAVLDRYGNEYSAVFVGAEVGKSAQPILSYPLNGAETPALFDFLWEGNSSVYEFIIADDPEFKNVLVKKEVTGNFVKSHKVYDFVAGKEYYWKVIAHDNNAEETESAVNSFHVDSFRILSPAEGSEDNEFSPVFKWNELSGIDSYDLVISTDVGFNEIVYNGNSDKPELELPDFRLIGNTQYYAKVTAMVDGTPFESEILEFKTKGIVPESPVFLTPAENGATLWSNSVVEILPRGGISHTTIMISASESFPARGSYSRSLELGTFHTDCMSDVKIGSKNLVDGETYYVRSRFIYVDENGKTAYTEWTEPVTFVYSAEAGIDGIKDDGITLVGGDEPAIVAKMSGVEVYVYGMDGKLIISDVTGESGRVSLSGLDNGAYMIVVESDAGTKTFKFLK